MSSRKDNYFSILDTGNMFEDSGHRTRFKELLDYYKKVNEWYRKGYVTAENFAYQSEDDTKEICVGGTVFANFGYDNHADNYNLNSAKKL